jgi:hypothetical protein
MQAADPARTDDHDVVPVAHPGQLLAVEDAGERLGHRRLGEAETLRDPVEPSTASTAWGTIVLGEPARVLVAHRRLVRADGQPALAALARAVRDRGDHLDAVADRPARDVRADLDDLAGDLVAHDLWRVALGWLLLKILTSVPHVEQLVTGS